MSAFECARFRQALRSLVLEKKVFPYMSAGYSRSPRTGLADGFPHWPKPKQVKHTSKKRVKSKVKALYFVTADSPVYYNSATLH